MRHSRLIRWIYYRFTQKPPEGGGPGLLPANLREQPQKTNVQPPAEKEGAKCPKVTY